MATSEVKGLWFVVARRYLIDRYDPELPLRIAACVDPALRDVILDPMRSAWYPEAALQQFMAAFDDLITRGDRKRLVAVFEECTLQGVHRFFQALLRLTAPGFLLRKAPVLWRCVRRGAGSVSVAADERRALVRYRDFPYFDDRNYQMLALGTLRPLATLCGGTNPRADVLASGKDWLDVEVRFHGAQRVESRSPSEKPEGSAVTDAELSPGARSSSKQPTSSVTSAPDEAPAPRGLTPSSSWRARSPSSRDS